MRNKWIIRLSFTLNLLLIALFITTGLGPKEKSGNLLISKEEKIRTLLTKPDSVNYELTTLQLASSGFQWPEGKKMGLTFSFDDAAITQIDNGIPLLNKYGVRATFYVSLWHVEMRLDGWKDAIKNGHEIGSHTRFHPCTVNLDFTKANPLEDYTLPEMNNEINSENTVLKKLFGEQPLSFAYPCGHTFVGRGLNTRSYVPLISSMFESGRGYIGGFTNPQLCDMAQLSAEPLDGKSYEQIKALIDTARLTGKWLILAGHKISSNDPADTQMATIEAICKYATDPSNGIWIDNIHNIASYVREKRGEQPFSPSESLKNQHISFQKNLWSSYYALRIRAKDLKNKLF
jgi:peptidoglycan/xylan/chitin deacetylase (PgdA/CDA1 family)